MKWKEKVRNSISGNNNILKRYDMEIIGSIRKYRKNGLTYNEISESLNELISARCVMNICNRYNWHPKHMMGKTSKERMVWNKGKILKRKDLSKIIKPSNLKKKLIREGIRKPICEQCGWDYTKHPWFNNLNEGNIPLEIHHRDGNRKNNNLENILLLCPNCHSLTPNFRMRNKVFQTI